MHSDIFERIQNHSNTILSLPPNIIISTAIIQDSNLAERIRYKYYMKECILTAKC